MANITDFVDVVITRDIVIDQQSFGNLLFIVNLEAFPTVDNPSSTNTRIRSYESFSEVYNDFPLPVDSENPTASENIYLGVRNMAVAFFNHDVQPEKLYIGIKAAAEGYDDALDAMVLEDNGWYAIAMQSRVIADQEDVADWVNNNASTNKKIVGFATNDANLLTSGDNTNIAAILTAKGANGYERAFALYHQAAYIAPGTLNANVAIDEWAEVAWFGKCLTSAPGSITWMYKNLGSTVTVSSLSNLQGGNVIDYNANTYERVAGVAITREGTVLSLSKKYIDDIIGIDWLVARIIENVYTLLVNSGKVPYTTEGIARVESKVKEVLALGVRVGLLADFPAPVTSVPAIADVPSVDKVDRILRNVDFTATLAGAVQKVKINGNISI